MVWINRPARAGYAHYFYRVSALWESHFIMKNNRNPLFNAVNFALSAGLIASLGMGNAMAEEEDGAKLDKIEVTGSRLKRTDIETASPVAVINREDIDASGDVTVAQVLQTTVYNSFGSFKATSGYGAGYANVNEVSIRGLGAQRTLVLMDGKRIASIPGNGGASQNLNQIPLDVVERIEILRDGASAVYGSDAIAGVVNIITRKDYDGLKITTQYEEGRGSYAQTRANVTGGISGAKGNIFYSLSSYDSRPQYYRELSYAANAPENFGISSFGFPGSWIALGGDFAGANFVDPRCPLNVGQSSEFPNSYRWDFLTFAPGNSTTGAERCGYNFAADIKSVPDTNSNVLFVNSNYEVSDNISLNTKVLIGKVRGNSRFAGTPVTQPFPTMSADNPNNPMPLYGLDPAPVLMLVRTVPNGFRDSKIDETNVNLNLTLTGFTELFGGADWELGTQFVNNYTAHKTYNLVNKETLQQLIDSGELDFYNVNGNFDGDIMRRANHTGLYEGETTSLNFNGNLRMDIAELPAGPAQLAVGFDTYNISFNQLNDPESNRLIIAGTSGGDNITADRDIVSLYFEAGLPITDMIELNLAGRYDDYSDFGSNFSPTARISFRPMDGLLLRATYGEGFRAPGFDEYYGNVSESFPSGIDFVGCNNGVAPCSPTQYRALFGGNTNLGPETSKSYTFGAVWQPMEDLNMELTFYHIEFDNWITTSTLNREFAAELAGEQNYVVRDPATGQVDYVSLQFNNFKGQQQNGVDFNIEYLLSTDAAGDFRFRMEAARVLKYEVQRFAEDPAARLEGEMGLPDTRINFAADWQMGDIFASAQVSMISGQSQTEDDVTYSVDDHYELDLQAGYNLPWNGKVVVGARNVTDENPELNPDWYGWEPFDFTIYSTLGRVMYVRYEQDF